ncbi:MAG: FkbM family methyltransferase, partial [Pyrinomonadaceae bacterium]
ITFTLSCPNTYLLKMPITFEHAFLKFVRLYTFNSPLRKGKYRLFEFAKKNCRSLPDNLLIKTVDGRKLCADLTDTMTDTVYFLGEYEPVVTKIVASLINKGDVCIDAGANFGWFTTLLHKLCSKSNQTGVNAAESNGEVHAFEPLPDIFRKLELNCELNDFSGNIFLNNCALGDTNQTIEIHRFKNMPSGHSSLAAAAGEDFETVTTQLITLDSYLEKRAIANVHFVKVDVEGAELMLLQGAKRLFKQEIPPFVIMEMALATSQHFGYRPNDLIEFLRQAAAYKFYAIDEVRGVLNEIQGFAPDDIGANVLCIPTNCSPERLRDLPFE